MVLPLFGLRQYGDYSACLLLYLGKKSSEYGVGKFVTEPKRFVVPLAFKSLQTSMEYSRCSKRKLQLEAINADAQLQWLKEQHPESTFTIEQLQARLGRIFHLAEGLDVDEFCRNPFETEA